MVRYQPVNAVNEITQPAISFTLFGTLVIFGIPLYDLLQARQGPQMRYCLWAPECVETPLMSTSRRTSSYVITYHSSVVTQSNVELRNYIPLFGVTQSNVDLRNYVISRHIVI